MAISNGIYLGITPTAPLQNVGWEVRVLSYRDYMIRYNTGVESIPLAVISEFVECTISPEISEVGAGSITLDAGSPFWKTQLTNGASAKTLRSREHLFQVYDNGLLRFEFLGQDVKLDEETEDEVKTITIAGPGGGDVLRRGKVMSALFPFAPRSDPTSLETTSYNFTGLPVMACWLILLGKCKARSTIQYVIPTFTDTHDSAGEPWEDTPESRTGDPIVINTWVIAGDVLFAPDSYVLKPAAQAQIDKVIAQISTTSATVELVGHTDSTNTSEHNVILSENRAQAVYTRMKTARPNAIIKWSGAGESQPIATNKTPAGRAKNRRVTIRFINGSGDGGNAAQQYIYEPPFGIDLLALLKELCGEDLEQPAPIRCEWIMLPGFKLDVRRKQGRDRRGEVIFYQASQTMMTESMEYNRESIANYVAVQDSYGAYSVAIGRDSIAAWGQREEVSLRESATKQEARGQIAINLLAQLQDETETFTMSVPPYEPGREVFVDYNLGDWIGVSRFNEGLDSFDMLATGNNNTVTAYRVMAISLKVANDNTVEVELTLQSTQQAMRNTLKAQIQSILDHIEKGTYTYIQTDPPTGAKVGDLWIPGDKIKNGKIILP